MTKNIIMMAISGLVLGSYTQVQAQRPELSDEQKACLESKIGTPGSGARPSKDVMDAAFSECGIEAPNFKTGKRHGPPDLTDEQRTCIDSKIGSTDSRPSREQMAAAMSECGVQRPRRGASDRSSSSQADSLRAQYAKATTSEEKAEVREAARGAFYASTDEGIKAQLRLFLKDTSGDNVARVKTTYTSVSMR